MPFITEFKSPDGKTLPIAAATFYTLTVPAATAEDKGAWMGSEATGYSWLKQLEGVTDDHIVLPSGDATLVTDCGLNVSFSQGILSLYVEHLPSVAKILTVTILNAVNGGEL